MHQANIRMKNVPQKGWNSSLVNEERHNSKVKECKATRFVHLQAAILSCQNTSDQTQRKSYHTTVEILTNNYVPRWPIPRVQHN